MTSRLRLLLVCITALVWIPSASAGAQTPIHRDVHYADDHPSQCVDVYLAESDRPTPAMIYIHGGGWRAGSKSNVPGWLKSFVAAGELSVVAVEYRFTDVATHPAQVNDCLRAVQFVRHNAAKWNIDPNRLGVTGGSAGGHLTAYVALHDDVAKPDSDDPVERQSSRVACAVSFAGPTDWSLLSKIDHKHPAYRQLIGAEPGTPAAELPAGLIKDVSPITFASKDDPPLMQVHGDKDDIVPIEHAQNLHEKLVGLGVPSELVVIPGGNHSVAGAGNQVSQQATEFVREHLLSPVVKRDLEFAKVGEKSLLLDLYLPRGAASPPLVVFIHGGGWQSGSHKRCPVPWLAVHGFAVASISYRLTDVAIFPAQIHDCKAAVRWLRAHAADYGYDASRIGVAGSSAGGHLAVLLGTSGGVKELEGEVGGNLDYDSRVQAIVDYYGATDFILRSKTQPSRANAVGSVVYRLLGGPASEKTDLARLASGVYYVTKDDPPLLILHGAKDNKVLMDQSERIIEAYSKLDLPSQLHVLPDAGHGGEAFFAGENRQRVIRFFDKHLRGGKDSP